MISDDDLLTLCVWDEAANQPWEGKAAVAQVVRHRMAAYYMSDGTLRGTILRRFQFSGFWFEMEHGGYKQAAYTMEDAGRRAEILYATARKQLIWHECADAAHDTGYRGSPAYEAVRLEPRTLLYLNPKISSTAWSRTYQKVASIADHAFFRAPL